MQCGGRLDIPQGVCQHPGCALSPPTSWPPQNSTFPKFLCDDRTGPTAPPYPPTPCLKIPRGAAQPLVRAQCGQAAPPGGAPQNIFLSQEWRFLIIKGLACPDSGPPIFLRYPLSPGCWELESGAASLGHRLLTEAHWTDPVFLAP